MSPPLSITGSAIRRTAAAAAVITACAIAYLLLPDTAPAAGRSGSPDTSVDEWSNSPPSEVDANKGVFIPAGLVQPVRAESQTDSIALLKRRSIVALTQEQARELVAIENPAKILDDSIQRLAASLQTFEHYPIDETSAGGNVEIDELKRQKEQRKNDIEHLKARIATLISWKKRLNPFLVRSIQVGPHTAFGANLQEDKLLVIAGAVGGRPTVPTRSAIVVYLPVEPKQVYTAISHMR